MDTTTRLLITCSDKPGIVSAVSTFLYNHGANITVLDQHTTDPEGGVFFMRLEFQIPHLAQTPHLDLSRPLLEKSFANTVAKKFDMKFTISYATYKKKTAILVSKHDHALLEILWLWSRKQLSCDICMVISNHPDLEKSVKNFSVPFFHVPVEKGRKMESEEKIHQLLDGKIDLIILARYMQILSRGIIDMYTNKIINIHHSFLPAFEGIDPYQQAYDKGVKLIGATAHYVTQELDKGPIIEQDVVRVSHRFQTRHLRELGRSIERDVLAKAVKWHLEDRVIVYSNRTVVFN